MEMHKMNSAIFLDRDGVICEETNLFYKGTPLTKPEQFKWIKGSMKSMGILSGLDKYLIIITNQTVINKGILEKKEFDKINKVIDDELIKYGRKLDGVYFCPHKKEEGCECRKPKTGLLKMAERDLGINLNESYMIGDKTSDILAGKNAGCKTVLVKTGYSGRDNGYNIVPDFIFRNLLEAAEYIANKEK